MNRVIFNSTGVAQESTKSPFNSEATATEPNKEIASNPPNLSKPSHIVTLDGEGPERSKRKRTTEMGTLYTLSGDKDSESDVLPDVRHVGRVKGTDNLKVYVTLLNPVGFHPYVIYYSEDPHERWSWKNVAFKREFKRYNEDQANKYFLYNLDVPEPKDTEGHLRVAKKIKLAATVAQMPGGAPSELVPFVSHQGQESNARIKQLEATVQNLRDALTEAQETIKLQQDEGFNGWKMNNTTSRLTHLESLFTTMQLPPAPPSIILFDNTKYIRKSGRPVDGSFLVEKCPLPYEHNGKIWYKETNLRDLSFHVSDVKTEVLVSRNGVDYTEYEVKDGTHVLVPRVGDLRWIKGRQYFEQIVLREQKPN